MAVAKEFYSLHSFQKDNNTLLSPSKLKKICSFLEPMPLSLSINTLPEISIIEKATNFGRWKCFHLFTFFLADTKIPWLETSVPPTEHVQENAYRHEPWKEVLYFKISCCTIAPVPATLAGTRHQVAWPSRGEGLASGHQLPYIPCEVGFGGVRPAHRMAQVGCKLMGLQYIFGDHGKDVRNLAGRRQPFKLRFKIRDLALLEYRMQTSPHRS